MTSRCGILNLPYEILDLVYKYIPDMRDKLNFAKAHGALGNAFAYYAGDMFEDIIVEDRTIQDWSDILSLCGASVTWIQTYDVNTIVAVLNLAYMYCPNLKEIFFAVRSSFWKHIRPLLLPLQNLNYIALINNFENINVVGTLLQMPKLKQLELLNFNRQDLEEVGKLVNLTKLTVTNKKNEPIDIFKTCSLMKSIDYLDLKFALIRVPKSQCEERLLPKIESLKISYGVFDTSLPYLPTLKDLTIDKTRMSVIQVFGESVFSFGKTLQSLRFSPESPRIIDADDIGIIPKLKALKRLNVQLGGDNYMDAISQLENLEVLILEISKNYTVTKSGVMMVINRCKKMRVLDISSWYYVDDGLVMEAVTALSLRPKAVNPLLICVNPGFPRVDKSKLGGVLRIQYTFYNSSWFSETYYG